MDDKKKTGTQDDIRVDKNDPNEVEYLHKEHPWRTHEEVKHAIELYGPFRKDIIRQLKR